jgi:uroporphyrinogen-III decarboxylase
MQGDTRSSRAPATDLEGLRQPGLFAISAAGVIVSWVWIAIAGAALRFDQPAQWTGLLPPIVLMLTSACAIAPELLQHLLDEMGQRCLEYARRLLEAGVRDVFGLNGPEAATPPFFSPARFDDMVVRYDRPLVDVAHAYGCAVVVHCHGPMNAVLERFAAMGVDALHPLEAPPMGDVTLADAKRRVGDRICLMGNIQIGDIMACTGAEIVEMTRSAIACAAPGGRFILTLSATPFERVLSPRTLQNLMVMIETALEYGSYSPNDNQGGQTQNG